MSLYECWILYENNLNKKLRESAFNMLIYVKDKGVRAMWENVITNLVWHEHLIEAINEIDKLFDKE